MCPLVCSAQITLDKKETDCQIANIQLSAPNNHARALVSAAQLLCHAWTLKVNKDCLEEKYGYPGHCGVRLSCFQLPSKIIIFSPGQIALSHEGRALSLMTQLD